MSLKYRIAVTIFALETVLIAVVLWGTLGYAMDHVRKQAARTDEVTIRLLNDLSRTALLTDEFAELQAFIDGDHKDPRIRTVIVADASDRVIGATEIGLIGTPRPATRDTLTPIGATSALRAARVVWARLRSSSRTIRSRRPIERPAISASASASPGWS
jgi:hypothetical protein